MEAHIFDIDSIITVDNNVWIVDKTFPDHPIFKISKSDFNLIKNGIYFNQGSKIKFNGKDYWFPENIINKLKIKAKKNKINFANLVISMQEFTNSKIIDRLDYKINTEVVNLLKNKNEDIYILCSKQTKDSFSGIILKLEDELKKEGIIIKDFFYISENFNNQRTDDIIFKKNKLLLQLLTGYKTEKDKFIDDEVEKYHQISYYENNFDTLKLSNDINVVLEVLLTKTEVGLREVIKEDVEEFKPIIVVNKINSNKVNNIESKKIILNISNIIKTFEMFKIIF